MHGWHIELNCLVNIRLSSMLGLEKMGSNILSFNVFYKKIIKTKNILKCQEDRIENNKKVEVSQSKL